MPRIAFIDTGRAEAFVSQVHSAHLQAAERAGLQPADPLHASSPAASGAFAEIGILTHASAIGDDAIEAVFRTGIRHLVMVPPAFDSPRRMDLVRRLARANRVPVTVLFAGHWLAWRQQLCAWIRAGRVGRLRKVRAHAAELPAVSELPGLLDLLCQIAGYCPLETSRLHGATTGFRVRFGTRVESAVTAESDKPAQRDPFEGSHGFQIEVEGSGGRIRYGDGRFAAADAQGTEATLEWEDTIEPPLLGAYRQIAGLFRGGPYPDCTNYDYAIVHEAAFSAIESRSTDESVKIPSLNR